MKVGVFGGSFDPPHLSHVAVCVFALSLTDLDKILVVPCFRHALEKELSRFEDRMAMCELAMRDLKRVEVSDVERELTGTSFTLHTLEHLSERNPDWTLSLIVGADALRDRKSWYRFERIEELANIVAFERIGVELKERALLPAPPEISSSEIRARLRVGERPLGLVPRPVLSYIIEHGLYLRSDG